MDGREAAPLPRKARALLAYLAMQDGKPVSRETVADLLWTDRGAEQARHSLRQTLLVLRRVVGPASDTAIRNEDGALALNAETDAIRLQALAGSEERDELAAALLLYRGPFLHDFPPIARDFDEWLGRMRAQMADHAMAAMGRLADHCVAARDWDEAVATVERMLALDPLREDVHRRMIDVCARAGRRSEALRHYQSCVEILRRELEVSPSAETEALVRRVRAGDVTAVDQAPARTVFAQPAEGPPWIAVLPFRAIGPDPVPGYFASGLVEDIVCALTTLREPIVVSSNSTLLFKSREVDVRQVGQDLGVRYVVLGTVRRAADWLRISAELVEAGSRAVLWAHGYDVQVAALFDAQDAIVAQIVHTLVPRMHEAELRRVRAKRPETMTAYDLMLQAREQFFKLDRPSFEQAEPLLRRAIALDSRYAGAHALLADWMNLRIGQGWSPAPVADAQTADRAALTAITEDPHNARALSIHAHNKSFLYRDYTAALGLFDRALEEAPNDATSWMWSASTLAYVGDGADAIRRSERALRLSPRDPFVFRFYASLCLSHYTAGGFEEAVHWGRRAAEQCPQYTSNLRFMAASLVAVGQAEEAKIIGRQILAVQPDFRISALLVSHPYRDEERRRQIGAHLTGAGLPE